MLLFRSLPLLVSKESLLSRHPSALNARFNLLLLGINILQEDILTNSAIKNVLRERIYTNALDYFRFVICIKLDHASGEANEDLKYQDGRFIHPIHTFVLRGGGGGGG